MCCLAPKPPVWLIMLAGLFRDRKGEVVLCLNYFRLQKTDPPNSHQRCNKAD